MIYININRIIYYDYCIYAFLYNANTPIPDPSKKDLCRLCHWESECTNFYILFCIADALALLSFKNDV